MKASTKLSVSIIISTLILSFNYVWINRFEFITYEKSESVFFIVNKWTGETCAVMFNADHAPVSKNKMFDFCPKKHGFTSVTVRFHSCNLPNCSLNIKSRWKMYEQIENAHLEHDAPSGDRPALCSICG